MPWSCAVRHPTCGRRYPGAHEAGSLDEGLKCEQKTRHGQRGSSQGWRVIGATISEEHKMNLFLCSFSNFDNGLLSNEIINIRNNEEA
jgi:hypothetical protein